MKQLLFFILIIFWIYGCNNDLNDKKLNDKELNDINIIKSLNKNNLNYIKRDFSLRKYYEDIAKIDSLVNVVNKDSEILSLIQMDSLRSLIYRSYFHSILVDSLIENKRLFDTFNTKYKLQLLEYIIGNDLIANHRVEYYSPIIEYDKMKTSKGDTLFVSVSLRRLLPTRDFFAIFEGDTFFTNQGFVRLAIHDNSEIGKKNIIVPFYLYSVKENSFIKKDIELNYSITTKD